MNREILEQPFDKAKLRTRPGLHGRTLTYAPAQEYVRVLNRATPNGAWDFEIEKYEVLEDEVIVLGKLTIDGTVKSAFGGSQITRAKDGGRILSLSNDLKAASSDALKRCCMRLGVGLDLYDDAPVEQPASNPSPTQIQPRQNHNNSGTGITSRQANAVFNLSRKLRISSAEMTARCQQEYGCAVTELDKGDASNLISSLMAEIDAGREAV